MARFGEDRAPLEMTKSSSRQKILVCPHCKTARSVSINTAGIICRRCSKYFNSDNSLPENEAEFMLNNSRAPDPDHVKFRDGMEAKAYAYKDKVNKQRRNGTFRTHEPGDIKKNY